MFKLPYYLKIEEGLIDSIEDYLEELGVKNKKVLLVTDHIIYNLYGKKTVTKIEKECEINLKIPERYDIKMCLHLAEEVINHDIDYIIGIGGGRVLDICKYTSYITKKRFVSIPTAIAHDGIASPIAVLEQDDGSKRSLGSSVPYAILIDTEIIRNGPEQLIKAGIGDILSNYTALLDWELASKKGKDKMNSFAYMLSSMSLESLLNCSDDNIRGEVFTKTLTQSLICSGIAMEICGTSRPCSGAEHLFSHALDSLYKSKRLHGLQVALGAIISCKLHNERSDKLLAYLKKYGVDIHPTQLGITEEIFINVMMHAKEMRKDRYTILSEMKLNNEMLSNLYYEICMEVN